MSTVEEFLREMKAIAASTTPEDRERFAEWVRGLPEAEELPEENTTVVVYPGKTEKD